jgi:hypothetical protein
VYSLVIISNNIYTLVPDENRLKNMITESESAGIRNEVESNISKIKWHCRRSSVGKRQEKQNIIQIENKKVKVNEKCNKK